MAAQDVEDLPFNYGLAMQGAEEVASHVVDKILTGGGLVMYQKYIEAKSLLFAKDATRDVLMSNLEMCFIPFDDGEIDQTIDGHCWDIEEEPVPQNIDSWAANHLCTAKQQARPPMLSAADKERRRLEEAERKRKKSMNVVKPKKEKKDEGKSTTRLFPLPDNTEPDEEAERYRLLKAEDKKKLQEKAKADAIKAKENEKEQIKMEALSAQMKDQPHTWDHLGNVIWIEHPRPDKLPALQATANAKIKADPRARREEGGKDTMNSTAGSNLASTAGKGKGKGKGDDKKKKKNRGGDDSDYTDGFAPLKGGQPDVIETMDVKSGVLLEVKSRKKMGRPVDGGERTMSRKEYVRLAEHEMSGGKDDETRPQPGGGGAYASADMPAAAVSKSPRNKAGRQAPPSVADQQPDAALTPTGRSVSETGSERAFRKLNTRRCGTLNLYEALGAGITEKVFNEICGKRKEMGYEEFCDARQKMQGLMQAQPSTRNRVDPLLNSFQRDCVAAGVNADHKHVESLDCRWRRRCSPENDDGEFGGPPSPTRPPPRPRGKNHLASTV